MQKNYELLAILDPDTDEGKMTGTIEATLEEAGVGLGKKDVWGLRTLAYPINGKSRGRYVLFNITSESGAKIKNLNNELRILDGLIRFSLIVQGGE